MVVVYIFGEGREVKAREEYGFWWFYICPTFVGTSECKYCMVILCRGERDKGFCGHTLDPLSNSKSMPIFG